MIVAGAGTAGDDLEIARNALWPLFDCRPRQGTCQARIRILMKSAFLLALLLAGACRSVARPPAVAAVHAPLRYKLSESVPSTVALGGAAITSRETVSFVTIGMRDSAGGSLWELHVDSTSSVIVPRQDLGARSQTMQLGPVGLRRPKSYRAYVRDGRVMETVTDGKVTAYPFSARNPEWSLLEQLPGLSSLPTDGLPDQVGDVRVDTAARHTPAVSGFVDDTTIVQWTKTAAAINGTIVRHTSFNTALNLAVIGIGSAHIVLDAGAQVVEARTVMEERQMVRPNAATDLGARTLVTTTTLVRVP